MVENETVDDTNVDTNDLDKFSEDWFGTKPAEKAEVVEEMEEEEVENPEEVDDLATDEASEEEVEEESEEELEPKPKKKHSAQERINKLTAEARTAQRELEALRREMETLKAGREKEEQPEALRTQLPPEAPNPDAVDKEGNPIYELGEFDPKFIRDLTKFTIAEETKAAKEAEAQKEWEEGVALAQQELVGQWAQKVEAAEESIPTIREDITSLTETFEHVDPAYGEYLAMTIMGAENGTEIMHYFSQNIGEAQKIVAAGPAAATLAIGRLDAKLSKPSTGREEQTRNKRVSKAPTPPERGARGVNGRQSVRPDTSDLDAFGELFYPKK